MVAHSVRGGQPEHRSLPRKPENTSGRMRCHVRRAVILLATLAVMCALLTSPQPATAWRQGRVLGLHGGGYPWGATPWVVFPFQRPFRDYRYSMPPGAPLSYDDPGTGTTYCWSQYTGVYYVCAYAPSPPLPIGLIPPVSPRVPASVGEPAAPPASGVLLFRLPKGAEVTVNGVPIGLSDGLGIHALPPGKHLVVLHVSGKATEHLITVGSHKILMVTPTGIVASEP
jgi:hypothetical protein